MKRRGFYFHWYIMGGGSEWLRMRFLIHVMELADCVFLMREPVNPYPYYVQSDLFVSTRMAGERDAAIEAALMLEMDVTDCLFDGFVKVLVWYSAGRGRSRHFRRRDRVHGVRNRG